jgi:hypothetical protein
LGGTQPLSKWQSICGFAGKKGKSEAKELELDLPAPDQQVLGEMVNAGGNSNMPPVPHGNHATLEEAGVIGTASDVANLSNRSHFSEVYFGNEDNFQDSNINDELKRTGAGITMYDYQEDGGDPT